MAFQPPGAVRLSAPAIASAQAGAVIPAPPASVARLPPIPLGMILLVSVLGRERKTGHPAPDRPGRIGVGEVGVTGRGADVRKGPGRYGCVA